MDNNKIIIYQLLPRLFTNTCDHCVNNGTIQQNGCGKFNDITSTVLSSIRTLGVTHVWYTGVIEHATQTKYDDYGIKPCNSHVVKGKAGSPYSIRDYYDVDPDLAVDVRNRMWEWDNLISRTHKAGLKVIMDFVPNHVAREYASDAKPSGVEDLGAGDDTTVAFSPSNNFYYLPGKQFSPSIDLGHGSDAYVEMPAKATGNDCFTASPSINDWYETIKLNYGINYADGSRHFEPIPSTWHKMLSILQFWAAHDIDGFRCDMAHMVPVEFWHWAISEVKKEHPNIIFIAEIYDVNLYRSYIEFGGFDYLYDKVALYDTLRGIQCNNLPASRITNCWQTLNGMQGHMLNFLENHDEQRIASQQFLDDAAKAIPSVVVSATISTCPFMIYAGQELGERASDSEGFSGYDGRTSIFDYWSVPTVRRWYNHGKCNARLLSIAEKKLRKFYQRLLKLCRKMPSIGRGQFFDLMYVNYSNLNPAKQYVYLRHYGDETVLIACNFDAVDVDIRVQIPQHAFDFLSLKPGMYSCKELLCGGTQKLEINPDKPIAIHINRFNAVMWQWKQ